MIPLNSLYEIDISPGDFKNEFELVRFAKLKKLIPKATREKIELKDCEYKVPMIEKKIFSGINPKTNRKKKKKTVKYLVTEVKPEDRTLKNLPRYSTKKPKVRFQDWLMLSKRSKSNHSVGQSPSGSYFGWSHRAIGEFHIGKEIKQGIIGNKFEYGKDIDKKYNDYSDKHGYKEADKWRKETVGKFKPYKIKTDEEAFEHAERFARDVS